MNASRAVVDMLEERNRQRFLVRRAAERKRASASTSRSRAHGLPAQPRSADARSRSAVIPRQHLPSTPWLLVVVASSLAGLLLLAVAGAYSLIRGAFGQ